MTLEDVLTMRSGLSWQEGDAAFDDAIARHGRGPVAAADPAALPWIAGALAWLEQALAAITA